jgi:hypothetical protein
MFCIFLIASLKPLNSFAKMSLRETQKEKKEEIQEKTYAQAIDER